MRRLSESLTLIVLAGAMIAGCVPASSGGELPGADTLAIFHNGTGPMCMEALAWLDTVEAEYPNLVVEEYLTTDPAGLDLFRQVAEEYGQSQGVSTSFGYLPVIIFRGQAFSGFNADIQADLEALVATSNAASA